MNSQQHQLDSMPQLECWLQICDHLQRLFQEVGKQYRQDRQRICEVYNKISEMAQVLTDKIEEAGSTTRREFNTLVKLWDSLPRERKWRNRMVRQAWTRAKERKGALSAVILPVVEEMLEELAAVASHGSDEHSEKLRETVRQRLERLKMQAVDPELWTY